MLPAPCARYLRMSFKPPLALAALQSSAKTPETCMGHATPFSRLNALLIFWLGTSVNALKAGAAYPAHGLKSYTLDNKDVLAKTFLWESNAMATNDEDVPSREAHDNN